MIKTVIASVFAVMCAAGIMGTAAAKTHDPQRAIKAETGLFSPATLTHSGGSGLLLSAAAQGMKRKPQGPFGMQSAAPAGGHPDEQRVLAVLRQRVNDIRLLEKVGHKLSAMSENRLRLVVSLSDRVAGGAPTAETDIAFLLLTTLIIFS